MDDLIYLDYHATTPCDPQVIEAMLPYFGITYGNPSSSIHQAGREAANAVESARMKVAELIGARPKEIIFTGGATESNNIALLGLANMYDGDRRRIVTTAVEHKSILNPCKKMEKSGYDIVILPVDREGNVDLSTAKRVIADNTLLVSVQAASNEIGTIQPIAELAKIAHERGAIFHCDAAQAVGKIPVDVIDWDIDLLSISAHKLYGPKGVGALYLRNGPYSMPINPLMLGGGQEHSIRPGTLNVPGIVGFGEACRLCVKHMPKEAKRISNLRNMLEEKLLGRVEDIRRNGALNNRLPNNSSLTFPGVDADALIVNTPELAISTGSACTSGAPEPSQVLQAIGLSRRDAYCTIRIGIGRFTSQADIDRAIELLSISINRLRSLGS